MAPTRPTTPPPREMESGRAHPSTPGSRYPRNGMIMGSEPATVPPSPSIPAPGFDTFTMDPVPGPIPGPAFATRKGKKDDRRHSTRTGAGVKKPQPKKKTTSDTVAKLIEITMPGKPAQTSFRFMDLPGELRNEVYKHVFGNPKQALLVHRPRIATLRSRTRVDRGRTLASHIAEQEHAEELSTTSKTSRASAKTNLRETNRPFWGLTQVCQQIRKEFHPIYMSKQEIGMDLTETVNYLQTFYPTATDALSELAAAGERESDMPFVGNLTIAVGDKPNELERSQQGIEIVPLLNIWANSFKIEAGFGRYLKAHYIPETDGEAKDLYRLFGRRVLKNRSCSGMNYLWRTILRARSLASVRIHRKLDSTVAAAVVRTTGLNPHPPPATATKPYIHILFKKEFAEPWMTGFESVIPKTPDWLLTRGFGGMEHFDVRVGVEQSR